MANASTIINDEMTLEEKLAAIDAAMQAAQDQANEEAEQSGQMAAPIDPQDFLMCEGCQ
ncbi:MAG TPA: hypothetical protein VLG36_00220 [Candidatus Chromulinivoraceae bacterium]|nr:hypothetical protein [Candidatus Chromulinivoraceae bacterium]